MESRHAVITSLFLGWGGFCTTPSSQGDLLRSPVSGGRLCLELGLSGQCLHRGGLRDPRLPPSQGHTSLSFGHFWPDSVCDWDLVTAGWLLCPPPSVLLLSPAPLRVFLSSGISAAPSCFLDFMTTVGPHLLVSWSRCSLLSETLPRQCHRLCSRAQHARGLRAHWKGSGAACSLGAGRLCCWGGGRGPGLSLATRL